MKVTVKKRGNSAGVRIPAAAHINLNQFIDVSEEQGRIVIEPVPRKTYNLDELLGGITSSNLHKLVDTGAPVGKEV
ncbi:MAG: PbsX family transcriptional regulator [Gallionellaceae bacterium]|jgi:antitoxin MazE